MTAFRTCIGCIREKRAWPEPDCDARAYFAAQIKGLGITSVRWKCPLRVDRFQVGDAVWVDTVSCARGTYEGQDVSLPRAEFPGIVVRLLGPKLLVYIDPYVKDCEDDVMFESITGNGFGKYPISRVRARNAEREAICKECSLPTHAGHQEGYFCHHELQCELAGREQDQAP